METRTRNIGAIVIVASGATLLAVAFGVRAVLGMFISPLNTATGLGFAAISLALALSQLAGGFAQPLWGAVADRHGPAPVVIAGGLLLAGGFAFLALAQSSGLMALAFCLIAAACAGVGSTATLLGTVTRVVPSAYRGLAVGIVSAGGSVGQLVVAPATQLGIALFGGLRTLFCLALMTLAILPIARVFRIVRRTQAGPTAGRDNSDQNTGATLCSALSTPSYWLICAGFSACGFHVSFLLAHMPGVIDGCGLASQLAGMWLAILGLSNIGGSIVTGLALKRFSLTRILFVVYLARAAGVALFLLAPKTQAVLLAFAVWMGCTYMATLPPTSALVGKLYGQRHIGSLFGVVMVVHQLGSFFGVWLGGVAVEWTGSYQWVWYADLAVAVLAAFIHLRIPEAVRDARARAARGLSPQSA